jgi:hypothetical protein
VLGHPLTNVGRRRRCLTGRATPERQCIDGTGKRAQSTPDTSGVVDHTDAVRQRE